MEKNTHRENLANICKKSYVGKAFSKNSLVSLFYIGSLGGGN